MSSSHHYAEIAVPRRLFHLFTYAIPDTVPGPWEAGMRVRIPFGREVLTGYVVRLQPPSPSGHDKPVKEILARLDDVPVVNPELFALTQWLAERYIAPPGQCLRLAFQGKAEAPKRRRARRAVIEQLGSHNDFGEPALTPALLSLRKQILDVIGRPRSAVLLLPGSSKDLLGLYRDAVERTLSCGRSAIVLVPETDEVEPVRRFLVTGGLTCEAYHSELPAAHRRTVWNRIQQGEVRVVVGTRSASLLPLNNLGLIIVDHEDHSAYKAQNAPRYDTREVAGERGRQHKAVVIMASPHPSLHSVYATGNTAAVGAFPTIHFAPVQIANLRDTPGEILSPSMIMAITTRITAGQRVLLYINRKGYASVLLCRDCGEALRCPSCKLGWNFHKREGMMSCRHCGLRAAAPAACPTCRGVRLFPTGFGTEAVEEAVRKSVPTARVARAERTRGHKKEEDAAVLRSFEAGHLDVLVGTQLLVSGTPRPCAALVGIIAPDAALHLPDFLAAERAYHVLREVISLVDPESPNAAVILQTYMPEHHVIRALAAHNPRMFYQNELMARAALGYPPFGQLIALRISGTREDRVAAAAKRWGVLLRTQAYASSTSARFELLGPIPAVPLRLRGRFRWQLVVKGVDGALLRHAVRTTLAVLESEGHTGHLRYDIDVDPQSLLN